ncbi:hypothetical protein KKB55_10825, partial [Myxococcota bacterium]|nr:hypothetical protein [Myxococcota bacterium]
VLGAATGRLLRSALLATEPAAPTPAVEPPSAAPTVSKKRGGRRRSSGQSKTTSQDDGEDEPPAAAAPKPSKPKAQPAKSSGGDTSDVDDLLGALDGKKSSGGGGGGRTQPPEPAADPMLPEQLSKNQILRVVKGGAGKVKACRTEGEGMVTVKMTIEKKGNVSTADAQGANAGSALGRCVESKVRAFRFPQFSGSPMTINMPFKI